MYITRLLLTQFKVTTCSGHSQDQLALYRSIRSTALVRKASCCKAQIWNYVRKNAASFQRSSLQNGCKRKPLPSQLEFVETWPWPTSIWIFESRHPLWIKLASMTKPVEGLSLDIHSANHEKKSSSFREYRPNAMDSSRCWGPCSGLSSFRPSSSTGVKRRDEHRLTNLTSGHRVAFFSQYKLICYKPIASLSTHVNMFFRLRLLRSSLL